MSERYFPTLWTGLPEHFKKVSERLCLHSIPSSSWEQWHSLKLEGRDGEVRSFPTESSPETVLLFVDEYLHSLLSPADMALPNRNRLPHWRGDLNKYRAWLLNRILRQLNEKNVSPDLLQTYLLPEDLPKIVDDLWLFHKHAQGQIANIDSYPDLSSFARVAAPYRPKYPISHQERIEAYACFLETSTPEELETLLPEGWMVSQKAVVTPDGKRRKRQGGSILFAQLEDGTQVIQVTTEKASRAYGSPRWCTAYRRRSTYFEDYHDNLLIAIAPHGERWQIHFRTMQFNDGQDEDIANPLQFLGETKGLIKALQPVISALFQNAEHDIAKNRYAPELFKLIGAIPQWRDGISQQDILQTFKALAQEGGAVSAAAMQAFLEVAQVSPVWAAALAQPNTLLDGIKTMESGGSEVAAILEYAGTNEDLRQQFQPSDLQALMVRALQDGEFIQPELLARAIYDIPGFRRAFSRPEGLPALLKESVENGMDRGLKFLIEHLSCPKNYREWHDTLVGTDGIAAVFASAASEQMETATDILDSAIKVSGWENFVAGEVVSNYFEKCIRIGYAWHFDSFLKIAARTPQWQKAIDPLLDFARREAMSQNRHDDNKNIIALFDEYEKTRQCTCDGIPLDNGKQPPRVAKGVDLHTRQKKANLG